jgi:hypothetical protein
MRQLPLFEDFSYTTQSGLEICFSHFRCQMLDALNTGDKQKFTAAFDGATCLSQLATEKGFIGIEIECWDLQREKWGIRANALIGKIYRLMANIKVSHLGLEEANRRRVHLQKKLNKIGKIARRRNQLREEDGYLWLESGSGLKPYLPL